MRIIRTGRFTPKEMYKKLERVLIKDRFRLSIIPFSFFQRSKGLSRRDTFGAWENPYGQPSVPGSQESPFYGKLSADS